MHTSLNVVGLNFNPKCANPQAPAASKPPSTRRPAQTPR
jgi:hypothetical protein